MRTIAFLSAILVATPALAGPCLSIDEPSANYYARYVAPPESRYAGGVIEFYGNHYVTIDQEDAGVSPGDCGGNTCYYDDLDRSVLFVVAFRDANSAVIRYRDDVSALWPADCQ